MTGTLNKNYQIMNIKLFAMGILLALTGVLTGCSSNESSERELSESEQLRLVRKTLAKVPKEVGEEKDLPVWLSEFIQSLEPDNMREVAAYKTRWKGKTVYYVYDGYFSCLLCTTFYSDGERLDWSIVDPEEFWETSTDWECIYLSEFKIQ